MDVSKHSTTRWWEDSQSMASQDGFYSYTGIYPSQANPLEVTPSSGYESPCSWTTNPTLQSQRRCSCGCMDPSSESSGNAGVVNFTLNCNVHLGTSPSNDQPKVPASSQYTIECSPEIFISPTYSRQPVATFVSPERYRKDSHQAATIQRSTERDNEGSGLPESGRLTPATSSANQEVLEYLAPQLLQYMNPMALLPYLQKHSLVDSADVDYICNLNRTDEDRRWRILRYVPYKGPNAFEQFVRCLSEEPDHPGHKYLARRLHEAIERKRTNPFKRLGSIRQRLYTDEFEETRFVPYPLQRLPTYPPAGNTSRHPPTTREQQDSVTSSEESDLFGVADEHDCSPHPHAQALFSTQESLLEETDSNECKEHPSIPPRPQTPTPYSESWSRRVRIGDSESDHKRSVHNRPPTPYSTRGSDEDEEEDTDSQDELSQAPRKPPTPTALSTQRSSKLNRGSKPKAAKGRRHSDSKRGAGIRRSPSEIKEKHSERKFQWLQDKVQFSECSEEVLFGSRTHFHTEREILYSGILHEVKTINLTVTEHHRIKEEDRQTHYIEHGKARFVVLLSDMLLVLKARKQGKPHHMEWFADHEYSMKTPLLLHFLTVQRQAKKASAECFCLHYNNDSQLVEICLKACSKEAKGIWVHELSEAIKACTAAHAATILPTGSKVSGKQSGKSYTKLSLTVFGARNLTPPSESHGLYCAFTMGRSKCRTHAVQGWPYPVWNFRCEFSDFTRTDTLMISIYSENIFQPDDLLGSVEVPLVSIPEEKLGLQVMEKQLPLTNGSGKISVHAELGWETNM